MSATLNSKITIPDHVLFKELQGEAVILNLESGKYFGLDEVGTRMWRSVTENGQVLPAYLALLEIYDVTEDQLRQELLKFLDMMVANGLLQLERLTPPD